MGELYSETSILTVLSIVKAFNVVIYYPDVTEIEIVDAHTAGLRLQSESVGDPDQGAEIEVPSLRKGSAVVAEIENQNETVVEIEIEIGKGENHKFNLICD